MKKPKHLLTSILILSAILLGACNLPTTESTEDVDATTIAATSAAVFTQAAETAVITLPSATTAPAATVIPTNTLPPTIPPATATNTPIPCNRASFVKDVTYADNTEVLPNTVFTKTWRIKNNGSCTWTSSYVLLFDSGDQMGASATAPITGGTVSPGATIDISVNLTSPVAAGTYQGKFKLRSGDNIVFGINANGQEPFWVKIVVPSPTPIPTETFVPTLPPPPPPLMPDLVITDITYSPVAPHKNDLVTVKVSTYNQGTVAAGAYTVKWYAAGTTLGCTWPVSGNNAGGGKVLTCTYTYLGWNNAYATKAIADTSNTVAESNETNNTLTKTLPVLP